MLDTPTVAMVCCHAQLVTVERQQTVMPPPRPPPPLPPWHSPQTECFGTLVANYLLDSPVPALGCDGTRALVTMLSHLWPRDAPGILASLRAFWNVFRFSTLQSNSGQLPLKLFFFLHSRHPPPPPPHTVNVPSGMHPRDCDRTDISSQKEQVVVVGVKGKPSKRNPNNTQDMCKTGEVSGPPSEACSPPAPGPAPAPAQLPHLR